MERTLAARAASLGGAKGMGDLGLPEHLYAIEALNGLAGVVSFQGDTIQGEALYRHARARAEKSLGPDAPTLALTLHNLAALYVTRLAFGRAEALFRRALRIREKALGPEHMEMAQTLERLAGVLRASNRHGEAAPLAARAIRARLASQAWAP